MWQPRQRKGILPSFPKTRWAVRLTWVLCSLGAPDRAPLGGRPCLLACYIYSPFNLAKTLSQTSQVQPLGLMQQPFKSYPGAARVTMFESLRTPQACRYTARVEPAPRLLFFEKRSRTYRGRWGVSHVSVLMQACSSGLATAHFRCASCATSIWEFNTARI